MGEDGAPYQEPSLEDQVRAQAHLDLDDILSIKKTVAYRRYFLRRLEEKVGALRASILHDPLSLEEYRAKQAKLGAILEIATMLDQDEQGNRSICGRAQPST